MTSRRVTRMFSTPPKMNSKALLDWYDQHKRSFPWRERVFKNVEEFAYHTWICEVMSQQTLLSVVLPKYEQFLKTLPNLESLQLCPEECLRYLWKGLGYYARARNLQKGAHYIIHELQNIFPKTQKEWEKVPGCGAYTSSIIASICYNEKIAAIDGNVIRVASRLGNIQDKIVWTEAGYRKIFQYLQNYIPVERPGDFNQALMDLGATICKKNEPLCNICPIKSNCIAFQNKTIQFCPPTKPRKTKINKDVYAFIIQNSKKNKICLIERNHGFLKKTIGFPLSAQKENFSLDLLYQHAYNNGASAKLLNKTFKHSITNHKIIGYVIIIEFNKNNLLIQKFLRDCNFKEKIQWIDKHNLKDHLSSSLDQKVYQLFFPRRFTNVCNPTNF